VERAGDDGHPRRTGSNGPAAGDTLGPLLAVPVTPATADDRPPVETLAAPIQDRTDGTGAPVELAAVDAGDTGEPPAADAAAHGIQRAVVTLPDGAGPKRGIVLLPRRWVVERGFAGAARFRRLARDYERLPTVLAGLPFVAFAYLMLTQWLHFISSP
jgi:transposase